jgi:POT family proton-dependent oligopeptide transporter
LVEVAVPPDAHPTRVRHPKGLSTLFFTEMWERFSYYGMRGFLILYMTSSVAAGGLGFSDKVAGSLYGTYTGSAWLAAIFGGIIADRLLGQYRSVLVGGIIIALGHFTLAFKVLPSFYAGLALIVIGTGLLKPNVSTIVGSLYEPGDARRDAGFSIFYMGINLGAFLGPIIAGYLAQRVNWHAGFACAGVGMLLGVVQYVAGRDRLKPAIERLSARRVPPEGPGGTVTTAGGFTTAEWKRIGAIVVFFLFAGIFWGSYEQAGSTLNLFGDRYTRTTVFGFNFPSSWYVSVQALWVIILAPIMALVWTRLGRMKKEPSSPAKFALGLVFAGLAFLMLIPAARLAQSAANVRVSPMWLVGAYFIEELGELCISPVGLSIVTKLAPVRIVGLMMGVWFLSNALGNKLAGFAAGFFSSMPLDRLFGIVAMISFAAGALLFVLIRPIKSLMGEVK